MQIVLLVVATLAAGLIQSVTGFGSGIMMMLAFPYILPVLLAASLSGTVSLGLNVYSTWIYHTHIRWKMLLLPSAIYCVSSTIALRLAVALESGVMLKILGGFLLCLSVFFLFFSDRIHVEPNLTTLTICSLISGVGSALFGIGGPPMVLYYLTTLKRKEEYLGTIQAFFLVTGLYTLVLRIINGLFGVELIPMTFIGFAAIVVGGMIGKRIVAKLPVEIMRKTVYIFLGISGLINLFS